MKLLHHTLKFFCIVALALSALPVAAQIWGPRTLDELKAETQRRADRNLPPIAGIKPEDARAAIARIDSLEREVWAAAWISNGERYMAQARSLESTSPREARDAYYHAWHNFSTGRWPSEKLSPGKQQAYERALAAFQSYGKLLDPPIETVHFAFEGKQVTAYLRTADRRLVPADEKWRPERCVGQPRRWTHGPLARLVQP